MQSRWRRLTLVVVLAVASLLGAGGPAAFASSGWSPTGSMAETRSSQVAAELQDGRVLVAGGALAGNVPVAGAEIYDPAIGTWATVAAPLHGRYYATATTLPDGRVLVVGGVTASGETGHSELYDPVADTWTATGSLQQARSNHRAVLLNDGRVLAVGGGDASVARASSEIYDPATGVWTSTGSMSTARTSAQAALLADGRVLVAGGHDNSGGLAFHASAEVYTPATGSWAATGAMATAHSQGAGVGLADGRVFVGGGVNQSGFNASIELYDPTSGAWTAGGSLGFLSNSMTGALLTGGRVLVAGDLPASGLYDPLAGTSSTYSLSVGRPLASLTPLQSGRALIAGGAASGGVRLRSAELFTPPTRREADDEDFGSSVVGDPVERDVTIENAGGYPLWVDGVAVGGDDAADFSIVADDCTGETVAASGTCVVRVRFVPSVVGPRAAELSFDDNADGSPAVALAGAGTVRSVDPGAGPKDPPTPTVPVPPVEAIGAPQPAPTAPVACPRRYVRLIGIDPTGTSRSPRVRLSGVAAPELAGRTVEIRRGERRVGTTRVREDGTVTATVATLRNPRAARRVRYRLVIDAQIRSAALKATRAATIAARKRLSRGRIRIDGRIRGVARASRLTVQGVPICGAGATVSGTARTDRRGRFRVVLVAPADAATALIYRVRLAKRTVTLPIVVPAFR